MPRRPPPGEARNNVAYMFSSTLISTAYLRRCVMPEMILLDFETVSRKVGLSRKTIYCRIREGSFPRQLKIGRASRWLMHEIDAWIEAVASER